MGNKYYVYMHTYKNKILHLGKGTYYRNKKYHSQRYMRAYQKANRGYEKERINYKDVMVHLFGNFDTEKEAVQYETHLHKSVKKGVDLIANRDKNFRILSQSQEDVYKSVSSKLKKKVRCITTDKVFNSISEASNELNIHVSRISEQLNGKRESCINPVTKDPLKFEYI